MANVPLPSVLRLASIRPRLVVPAQRNRSRWTGRSKILGLPGCAYWTAQASFRVLAQEFPIRQARAFFASLRGMGNTFDLPVTATRQIPMNTAANVFAAGDSQHTLTDLGSGWYRATRIGAAPGQQWLVGATAMARDFLFTAKIAVGGTVPRFGVSAVPSNAGSAEFWVHTDGGAFYAYVIDDQAFNGNPWGSPMFPTAADYPLYVFLRRTNGSIEYLIGKSADVSQAFVYYHAANTESRTAVKPQITMSFSGAGTSVDFRVDYETPSHSSWAAIAAGARSASLAIAQAQVSPGMYATLNLNSGHRRLVQATQFLASQLIVFEPDLPEPVNAGNLIEVSRPVMRVRLSESEWEHEDSNGNVVFGVNVEEAL